MTVFSTPPIDRALDQWVAFRIDPVTIQRLRAATSNRSAFIRDAIQRALSASDQPVRIAP